VLARFPGAEIVDVRKGELPPALPAGDSDDVEPELPPDEDGSAFGAHAEPADGDDNP
jgi:hypothetical protein